MHAKMDVSGETLPTGKVCLSMRQIGKRYGPAVALDGVDFEVNTGEIMALLGENGAGKSTLVKVMAGLERADDGTIAVNGKRAEIRSPADSAANGIACVTQELSIIGALSVAENIFIGHSNAGNLWTARRLCEAAKPFLESVGLGHVDPSVATSELSVAEQQLVEIARVLSRDAQIIILDEPTAALADSDIARILEVVRGLADRGRSIIYVTHRLGEVFTIADKVTVLRNGKGFPPLDVADLTPETLIEEMLGRRLQQMFPERGEGGGKPLLEVRDVAGPGLSEPVNLTVRAGEIVGCAGQIGSGAAALLRMIAGMQPIESGEFELDGDGFGRISQRAAMARGIAYCSDDRKRDGIFTLRPVRENCRRRPCTRSPGAD